MKLLTFFVIVSVESKGGLFFAEPYYVSNTVTKSPEIADSYFYLQQIYKSNVLFLGDIKFKRLVGPLMLIADTYHWSGKTFRKAVGSDHMVISACHPLGFLRFFQAFKPQSGFDQEKCTFQPGNYTLSISFNDYLHETTQYFSYDPVWLRVFVFEPTGVGLFGFDVKIRVCDLTLYQFLDKN